MSETGFIVIDIAGTELSQEDRALLSHPKVVGLILFARNYQNKQQLQSLIKDIIAVKPDCMLMVDHEGGRVQRFKEDFTILPTASYYGDIYDSNGPENAFETLRADQHTAAQELLSVGININLGPLLDLDLDINSVMRGRCYHSDPAIVQALAATAISTAQEAGLFVAIKHFPGHGKVTADSHVAVPHDSRQLHEIEQSDLLPFIAELSRADLLMPAHIIFKEIDSNPVTFSKFWLQDYLRDKLGYHGVVVSDDLSMVGAHVAGTMPERAYAALNAGCDLLLLCNDRAGTIATLDYFTEHNIFYSSHYLQPFIAKLQLQLTRETHV